MEIIIATVRDRGMMMMNLNCYKKCNSILTAEKKMDHV
jgi:hypothetical protein